MTFLKPVEHEPIRKEGHDLPPFTDVYTHPSVWSSWRLLYVLATQLIPSCRL